jgi:hypothetical protein
MNRDYTSGTADSVIFFIGYEVEHTPAFGMKTLFVTGIQPTDAIDSILNDQNSYIDTSKHIKHIFFGANHSFNPTDYDEHKQWEDMIYHFLKQGYLCSLDIPMSQVEEFHESGYCEYDNFIPQIRVPIPYIKLWNYNTMLKIDDKDFKATNPGVWSHSLHTLMDRKNFTDWSQYKNDEILK